MTEWLHHQRVWWLMLRWFLLWFCSSGKCTFRELLIITCTTSCLICAFFIYSVKWIKCLLCSRHMGMQHWRKQNAVIKSEKSRMIWRKKHNPAMEWSQWQLEQTIGKEKNLVHNKENGIISSEKGFWEAHESESEPQK